MSSHFLYELKARLEHAVKIVEPTMFKAEVESILRDLCIEVDTYGAPGDEDPNVNVPGREYDADDKAEAMDIWEEPSKTMREAGAEPRNISKEERDKKLNDR